MGYTPGLLDTKMICVFEPLEAHAFRMVVLEEEPESGSKQVFDIIVIDRRAPLAQQLRAAAFFERTGLEPEITWRAPWDVDLSRTRTHAGRVRRIIEAYPGAEACAEKETVEIACPARPLERIEYTIRMTPNGILPTHLTLYLFEPQGQWDGCGLTLAEAEEKYPRDRYRWVDATNTRFAA